MLAIKFKRIGKKHQASFRIIVTEKRSKLQGRYVDDLGWFNPHNDQFNINKERASHWLKNGAQPTDSIHNLLVRASVIKGPKRPVHKVSKASSGLKTKPESMEIKAESKIESTESAVEAPVETITVAAATENQEKNEEKQKDYVPVDKT